MNLILFHLTEKKFDFISLRLFSFSVSSHLMKKKSSSVSSHWKKISSCSDSDLGQNWTRTENPGSCNQFNKARDSSAARMQLCSLILSVIWYHLQFDIVSRFDMICSLISSAVWYYVQFDIVYTHLFYFSYSISIVHLLVSIFLD